MRKNDSSFESKSRKHLIVGTPYEPDCPICQAHGEPLEDLEGLAPGVFIVEVEPLEETHGCDCPLCAADGPDPLEN